MNEMISKTHLSVSPCHRVLPWLARNTAPWQGETCSSVNVRGCLSFELKFTRSFQDPSNALGLSPFTSDSGSHVRSSESGRRPSHSTRTSIFPPSLRMSQILPPLRTVRWNCLRKEIIIDPLTSHPYMRGITEI